MTTSSVSTASSSDLSEFFSLPPAVFQAPVANKPQAERAGSGMDGLKARAAPPSMSQRVLASRLGNALPALAATGMVVAEVGVAAGSVVGLVKLHNIFANERLAHNKSIAEGIAHCYEAVVGAPVTQVPCEPTRKLAEDFVPTMLGVAELAVGVMAIRAFTPAKLAYNATQTCVDSARKVVNAHTQAHQDENV
jgi:hypothetical protein